MNNSLNRSRTNRTLVLFALLVPASLFAQDSASTSVSGFVDIYYAYSLQNHPLMNRTYTTQPLRVNDFNLNLALVELKRESHNIRGSFAFQTGTYVESNLAMEPSLLKNIYKASVGTRLFGDVWLDAGIFPSHIGFEGIVSKDNWNYSRCLLADYSPYYEAGVSITVPLSELVSARGLILNGWQNINETNKDKSLGTQITYKPTRSLLINWSALVGNEAPDTTSSRLRVFNDFYVTFVSESWSIAGMFDIGFQRNPLLKTYEPWHAGAIMLKRVINDRWTIAGRVEYYYDAHGIIVSTSTPNNFQTVSGSLNFDFSPVADLVWRLEVRLFGSKDEVYPTENGLQKNDGFVVFSGAISL